MRRALLSALVAATLAGPAPGVHGQTPELYSDAELEVSYIYSAVMGSGTYKIRDRRITMFRLPFSWTQREASEDRAGLKWLLPVVVGYDDLGNVDSDWVDALLPDQLVVASFLPGLEYIRHIDDTWQVKPFVQLGGGRDFKTDETVLMTQLGVRTLGLWKPADAWELRWGNTLHWAGERQRNSGDRTGFGVFETGLDVRRDLPFLVFERSADLGAYYIYERFMPRWTAARAPDLKQKATNLYEFGLSVGFKEPRKILRVPVQRLRLGYKWGDRLRGWSIGTEFPF